MNSFLLPSFVEPFISTEITDVETNTAQLYVFSGRRYSCVAPARSICGRDGTCAKTTCRDPIAEYIQQPLGPLSKGYSSAMKAYMLLADSFLQIVSRIGGLPVDLHFPQQGVDCSTRLSCLKRRVYERGKTRYVFDTLRPYVYIPTLFHYRVLRIRKRGIETYSPWVLVKEYNRCRVFICDNPECYVSVNAREIEFSHEPLVNEKPSCGRHKVVPDSLAALLARELSGLPEVVRPRFSVLGTIIPIALREVDEGVLNLVLWNFSSIASRAVVVFSSERILSAHVLYPSGQEEIIPEYDRVVVPVRAHGLAEVRLTVRRLPPLLLGKRKSML